VYAVKLEIHQGINIADAMYLFFYFNQGISLIFIIGNINFIIGAIFGCDKNEREMNFFSIFFDLSSLFKGLISQNQMLVAYRIHEFFS